MTSQPRANKSQYGWECHDCGEVYTPNTNTTDCLEQGHYVGPISACELPLLEPYLPNPLVK
jgi:hypothetical protein